MSSAFLYLRGVSSVGHSAPYRQIRLFHEPAAWRVDLFSLSAAYIFMPASSYFFAMTVIHGLDG